MIRLKQSTILLKWNFWKKNKPQEFSCENNATIMCNDYFQQTSWLGFNYKVLDQKGAKACDDFTINKNRQVCVSNCRDNQSHEFLDACNFSHSSCDLNCIQYSWQHHHVGSDDCSELCQSEYNDCEHSKQEKENIEVNNCLSDCGGPR